MKNLLNILIFGIISIVAVAFLPVISVKDRGIPLGDGECGMKFEQSNVSYFKIKMSERAFFKDKMATQKGVSYVCK